MGGETLARFSRLTPSTGLFCLIDQSMTVGYPSLYATHDLAGTFEVGRGLDAATGMSKLPVKVAECVRALKRVRG